MSLRVLLLYHIMALLLSVSVASAADTLVTANETAALWRELQQANVCYQQGKSDSALMLAKTLLPAVEANGNELLLAMNHVMLGTAYGNMGMKQEAQKEFAMVAELSETCHFDEKARQPKKDYLYQTMVSVYAQLAMLSDEAGQTAASVEYSKKGMEWISRSPETDNNYIAVTVFTEMLLKHGETLIFTDNDTIRQDTAADIEAEETQQTAEVAIDSLTKTVTATVPLTVATDQTGKKDADNTPNPDRHSGTAGLLLAGMVALFATYVLWQRRMRKKRKRQTALQMDERFLEGQESERARLARELHDNVSNQLLAVEMKLNSDGLTTQTMQLLNESREQVRRVSHELLPPEFEHIKIHQAMADYASGQDGLNHCQVTFMATPDDAQWSAVPAKTALEVYRIMQEAVANAQRHAGATLIAIGLHLENDGILTLTVSDDGLGDEGKTSPTGIGQQTMRQRATAIGGNLTFYRHHYGCTVKLAVDLQKKHKN